MFVQCARLASGCLPARATEVQVGVHCAARAKSNMRGTTTVTRIEGGAQFFWSAYASHPDKPYDTWCRI